MLETAIEQVDAEIRELEAEKLALIERKAIIMLERLGLERTEGNVWTLTDGSMETIHINIRVVSDTPQLKQNIDLTMEMNGWAEEMSARIDNIEVIKHLKDVSIAGVSNSHRALATALILRDLVEPKKEKGWY
jgi:hypothetical protein